MIGMRRVGARAAVFALRTAALFALWLALTDRTDRWETRAGFACALVAAGVAELVTVTGGVRVAVRGRWLLRALPAPWWVLRDSVLVLGAILTRRRGRLRAVPFPHAGGDAPLDRGRRAVALGLGSAGPNQYALTEASPEDVLVVHELVPREEVTAVDLVRAEAPGDGAGEDDAYGGASVP